jgi:capsular exopolysaccharide synthesis family protein
LEKLEIYKKSNYVLNDAFDETVMNLHIQRKQKGYKSFVLCGCEVGDGTTTIAINLSVAMAISGWKTVLIDGDMRRKNSFKRLNESVKNGLSDYLQNNVKVDDIVYETTTENLSYLHCGSFVDNPTKYLCSEKITDFADIMSQKFDFIFYDMPAVNVASDAKMIAVSADAVILVSSIGKTSKKGLVTAANSLTEVNANLIGTIINKMDMEQYKYHHKNYDYFMKEKYSHSKAEKKG